MLLRGHLVTPLLLALQHSQFSFWDLDLPAACPEAPSACRAAEETLSLIQSAMPSAVSLHHQCLNIVSEVITILSLTSALAVLLFCITFCSISSIRYLKAPMPSRLGGISRTAFLSITSYWQNCTVYEGGELLSAILVPCLITDRENISPSTLLKTILPWAMWSWHMQTAQLSWLHCKLCSQSSLSSLAFLCLLMIPRLGKMLETIPNSSCILLLEMRVH